MAGYVISNTGRSLFEFHIDTPDVSKEIQKRSQSARVIMLQLDGDELDAALWGLENYQKRNPADRKDH